MLRSQRSVDVACSVISEGDLVVVYERFDSLKSVKVNSRKEFSNKFGHFRMQDWLGKRYGSKVFAKPPGSGWVYLLRPTPELWTRVLLHRTQILYAADISLICSFLELRPGATVLECGTGSGSLTHALARAVAPTGHVHTFEFHEQRASLAAEEFREHGLEGLVSVAQRDIEKAGFPEELHGQADAVFLDVPGPWRAVASAGRCLRPGSGLATFSPCIEQVQRTRRAMAIAGFWDVRVVECLLRDWEVCTERLVTDVDAHPVACGTGSRGRKRKYSLPQPAKQREDGGDDAATLSIVAAKPVAEGRGHTGYLVFARSAVTADGADAVDLAENINGHASHAEAVDDASQE